MVRSDVFSIRARGALSKTSFLFSLIRFGACHDFFNISTANQLHVGAFTRHLSSKVSQSRPISQALS